MIAAIAAGLAAWGGLALAGGIVLGRSIDRRDALAAAGQAWDNGFCHGIDTAHTAVLSYRKPWITYSEELGWDLARDQLAAELDRLRPDPDTDEPEIVAA